MAQRHPRTAAVRRPCAAAAACGSGLLRPAQPAGDARPGAPGRRVRHRRVLLLLLLVQRSHPDGGSAAAVAGRRWHRPAVLPVLGQRELDTSLGRARRRDPDRTAAQRRGRPGLHRPRRPLPARPPRAEGRRPADAAGLPPASAARSARHRAALAPVVPRQRRRRAAPGLRAGLRTSRSAGHRLRRGHRVPAEHEQPALAGHGTMADQPGLRRRRTRLA